MRIALDAMGGDCGSSILIQGALAALPDNDLEISLLGPKEKLRPLLAEFTLGADVAKRLHIVHASEVVGMDESPVEAVRRKKDSTIIRGFEMLRRHEVDAVVSAGNSGATLAAAIKKLGRLKNVSRPGICSIMPTLQQPVFVMDVGANVECRPQHLLQFAVMASACSRALLSTDTVRIGLLSIGEESGKGNSLVKASHELLKNSSLNYIGNVEGRDIFQGNIDVIVCDGFVGNICLKASEGLADAAMHMLREEIGRSWVARLGYLLSRRAFAAFKKRIDYAEYGGAPLLGINGIGIICHGGSNIEAIKNAVFEADKIAHHRVNEQIVSSLAAIAEEQQRIRPCRQR